jgi:hypothetical protein
MSSLNGHINHTIIRGLIVIASGIGVGFLFNRSLIFIPTMVAFQFTYSSITAGLFYAFLKSSSLRSALLAALVWYVASTVIDPKNHYTLVMDCVYVVGISAAVYLYLHLIRGPVFNGIVHRIATMSLLTGLTNALIAIGLVLFWAVFARISLHRAPQLGFENFQIGTLIGLGVGVGIELAEYVVAHKSFQQFIGWTR